MKHQSHIMKVGLFTVIMISLFFYTLKAQDFIWIKKSNMIYKCAALASCEIDGKIYAVGGTNGVMHNNEYGDAYLQVYDIAQNKWSLSPLMKYPRMMLGVANAEGKIYAIGGGWSSYLSKKIEVYDPILKTWTEKTDRPKASSAFGTCAINGKIFTFGGTSVDGKHPGFIYDIASDTWTDMTEITVPSAGIAFVHNNGKIYAMGGVNKDYNTIKTLQVYDIASDKWELKSDMPHARFGATAVAEGNKIYVFGGAVFPTNTATNNIQIYDISTDTWTENNLLPVSTQWSSAVKCSSNNKIYLMGGEDKCMMTYTNAVMQNFLYELDLKTSAINESITQTYILDIFPNPGNNEINLFISNQSDLLAKIEIQDINGVAINTLMRKFSKEGEEVLTINIEDLKPGIYICQIQVKGKQTMKKFIKL